MGACSGVVRRRGRRLKDSKGGNKIDAYQRPTDLFLTSFRSILPFRTREVECSPGGAVLLSIGGKQSCEEWAAP